MSEKKSCEVYGPHHKATKIGLELKAEKEASKDNKLPKGALKKRLVKEELISNVSNTDHLKGEERNVYVYVGRIVGGKINVAKPCSTNRKLMLQRTRRRGKSNMKELVDAPGGDDGGWG